MDYEYAVEPQAVATSWDRFQNIISRFGFEKGKLISDFPQRDWSHQVRLATEKNGLGEKERKQISEGLDKAKRESKVRRFGRSFDNNLKWLQNAVKENERKSFAKIIARESEVCSANVIFVENVDDENFKIDTHVKRDVDSLLSVSDMLLRFSSRIDIIDPYIRIDRLSKDRNTRVLLNKFLNVVKGKSESYRFRIHFRDSRVPIEHIRDNLFRGNPRKLFDFVPVGMSIEMFCWRKRVNSNLPFHDRYLLGNKGGISLGAGFKPEFEETTTLGRHDLNDIEVIRQCFAFDGTGHEWIEPGFRIFPNRRPELVWHGDI